jgi:hypothetical protein
VAVTAVLCAMLSLLSSRSAAPERIQPPDEMVLLFDVANEPDAEWDLPAAPEPVRVPISDIPDTAGRIDTAIPGADPDADSSPADMDTAIPGVEGTGAVGTPGGVGPEPTPSPGPVSRPASGSAGPKTAVEEEERIWDIALRNRLRPSYPRGLRDRGYGDVTCRVEALVDRDGVTRQAYALRCPAMFRTHARAIIMEASWETFEEADPFAFRKVVIDVPYTL